MLRMSIGILRQRAVQSSNLLIATAFALSGLMPILLSAQADAAQLASRKVTITSSEPSKTNVSYAFAFTIPTGAGTPVQSIAFSFCTTPLGTCTLPTGMDVGTTSAQVNATQTFSQTPVFTEQTSTAGACSGVAANNTATQYCVTRTGGTSGSAETDGAGNAKAITVDGITNPSIPSGNNTAVYIRIALYSDNAFATPVQDGTVAAAIVNQLTVTGRVQERLVFCVFALDDVAGSSATAGTAAGNMPTDCTASEATASTNVDMGVIDNSTVAKSPVNNTPPTSLGNDRFGAALLNTNATSGVALTYYPTLASSGTNELRAFRVPGSTCNVSGTSLVDQCFISAATTGEGFVAGTERFGTQIVCVANAATNSIGTTSNLGKNGAGTYTSGSGAGGSFNTAYSNTDDSMVDDGSDDCENSDIGVKFAWDASGTAVPLISSVTVVDDELVKMRYGATASATTPTGTYTVATTYIATPTF